MILRSRKNKLSDCYLFCNFESIDRDYRGTAVLNQFFTNRFHMPHSKCMPLTFSQYVIKEKISMPNMLKKREITGEALYVDT